MDKKENKSSFQIDNYRFEEGEHNRQQVIWIIFPYNRQLINDLKAHVKAKWSFGKQCWYVPNSTQFRHLLHLENGSISNSALKQLTPANQAAIKRLIEHLQLKGYSPNTIRTYSQEFFQLLKAIKNNSVNGLTSEKLRSYFLYCTQTLKVSENLIHSRTNAVKFYFEQVLHRKKMFFEIPRPKKPSTLPKSINQSDLKRMFDVLDNRKHQLLLKMCYGMGLRVSELVNLKVQDIDSSSMQVLVSRSKGKKDRYVILPESVLNDLRLYYLEYKPKDYLFEGINGGQYNIRSVQLVFKSALKKAKVNKKIGVHGLRHSYATHLIEQGTDIRFVQELLGHNNIKTTMAYTRLTDQMKRKIKSPLDNL
ncbi:MAG: tyrosine-type recombinase/integrase [Bacteroidia bacterium]|nr:tyrosine-type recombinase/integrase [Bacteroidia bacterium]MBP7715377.1 tyrosine-type recombinase/integrase [Bacteroidia bacterium]MBP8669247.1 tyrosine-type recombinase/integrase [Bacteroidia bacterium]HQW18235.1 tyrosine-type recombinase/integrase [Bacteroidia bacterium]HQW49552.1 tyrosine-type recombinase/integrase [Bacteroidia bacterium]